jgi:chromosome segregation ATPase
VHTEVPASTNQEPDDTISTATPQPQQSYWTWNSSSRQIKELTEQIVELKSQLLTWQQREASQTNEISKLKLMHNQLRYISEQKDEAIHKLYVEKKDIEKKTQETQWRQQRDFLVHVLELGTEAMTKIMESNPAFIKTNPKIIGLTQASNIFLKNSEINTVNTEYDIYVLEEWLTRLKGNIEGFETSKQLTQVIFYYFESYAKSYPNDNMRLETFYKVENAITNHRL